MLTKSKINSFPRLLPEKVPYENNARVDLNKIRHGETEDPFLYNPRSKTVSDGQVGG